MHLGLFHVALQQLRIITLPKVLEVLLLSTDDRYQGVIVEVRVQGEPGGYARLCYPQIKEQKKKDDTQKTV